MPIFLDEAQAELALLEMIRGLGYDYAFGPDLAPDGSRPERASYADVVLVGRLEAALRRINPGVPASAIDAAVRKLTRAESPSLMENNRRTHRFLTDGVAVEYRRAGQARSVGGETVHGVLWPIDFAHPEANEFLAVNQFTVQEDARGRRTRRADVVLFVNGLPIAVIELKNPADAGATIRQAFQQLQTYKQDIPSLFAFNDLLVVSDGLEARVGTLTADWERFMPWRTVDGKALAPAGLPQAEVLIPGLFEKGRLLDLIRHFVVFEDGREGVAKKLAGYHQFHAVNKAVESTVKASAPKGNKRIGVVWHTQGSGKSLSMLFYAGKIIQHPAMGNPTLVVLTDRNDLDDQLFGTFSACRDLLRQTPQQAEGREHLRELLKVASGGVIFTTIQKFLPPGSGMGKGKGAGGAPGAGGYPLLSDRRNIVVVADEAHRSQYDFIDGYASHLRDALPNASFIGFTGTPIEAEDRSTQAVFGDYIDTYDIEQAVEDGATVRIYYEARLAKLELKEGEKAGIDPSFEEVTEGEEVERKEKLKSKWAALEAIVGTDKRIGLVAADLVQHFEKRREAMEGKGLIVCMSRRICAELYKAIVKLRPDWHDADEAGGAVKVVMTGSASDPLDFQPHIRNKPGREAIAKRFKDPADPLKLVIVRDMWLTGFDVPCLHTMYVDKPMQGHGLMQAIARVNRVFRDKPGGLVVDYLGLADQLRKALADYTRSGGRGKGTVDQGEAVAVMLGKYEVVCDLFHGFDYQQTVAAADPRQWMRGIAEAMNFILGLDDGKARCLQAVTELSKAFALAVPHEEALKIKDEVGFFQAVRAGLAKMDGGSGTGGKTQEEMEAAIRQIVSKAVAPEGVMDIFAAAGLKKPDISILSEEFMAEVKNLPQRNLAVELLRKLLNDEIKVRQRKNVVQARSFAGLLEEAIRKYQNRAIEAAEVIEQLINLAKELKAAQERGQALGLNDDETAFYDALEVNDSAVAVLGDENLRVIARELVEAVRKNVSIDWTVKEGVRAKLRTIVKRILRKHGYPPDKQEKATQTVLEQAEVLCANVAA